MIQRDERLDARSLRGLAHPLRVRLLGLLRADGPATATGLAQQLGESSGTTSWHLRRLAEHGFVEEDTGRGNKRERWWKARARTVVLDPIDFHDDPELRPVAEAYLCDELEHSYRRVLGYLDADWSAEWVAVANPTSTATTRLTPDEADRLNAEITELVRGYQARHDAAQTRPGTGTASGTTAETAAANAESGTTAESGTRTEFGATAETAAENAAANAESSTSAESGTGAESGSAVGPGTETVLVQWQLFPHREEPRG